VVPSPVEPHFGPTRYLLFEGISVDREGKQPDVDASVSYADACTEAISCLSHFGCTEEQAYIILSCAPCEGRISAIVEIPSVCCSSTACSSGAPGDGRQVGRADLCSRPPRVAIRPRARGRRWTVDRFIEPGSAP
jgi:Acetamidase/Formamidase family